MTPGFDPSAPDTADAPAGALPLADAIASLRAELERAMVAAPAAPGAPPAAAPDSVDDHAVGSGLRLEAEAVQLTVEAVATTSGTGRAGIRWWLLEAGGEASHERTATQSVTISFVPTIPGPDGGRVAPTFRPRTGGRDGGPGTSPVPDAAHGPDPDRLDRAAPGAPAAPRTPLRQPRDSWAG